MLQSKGPFNLLPSAVLATMLSVDKIGVGGMPLLGFAFGCSANADAIVASAQAKGRIVVGRDLMEIPS